MIPATVPASIPDHEAHLTLGDTLPQWPFPELTPCAGENANRRALRLDQAGESSAVLLVLTPDDSRPTELNAIQDDRLAWMSFALLDQAINELLDDSKEVVSEREAFLLRELQSMLEAERMLANPNDVVIVAARSAWPEYNESRQTNGIHNGSPVRFQRCTRQSNGNIRFG